MYLPSIFSLIFLSCLLHFGSGNPNSDDDNSEECCSNSNSRLGGTLVPVLVPDDAYDNVKYSTIPKYADFLCEAGVNGVVLFSEDTEGALCTLEEKKLLVKTWVQEAKRCDLTVVCQVGISVYNESLALASYCKEAGADAVMSSPNIIYASYGVEGVVEYLKALAQSCHPKPFMYSDLGLDCNFDYNTANVVRLAKKRIKNFYGVKTNYIRAMELVAVLGNSDIAVIASDSAEIVGAYAASLNGTSTLIANVFPKQAAEIKRAISNGDYVIATNIQKKINRVYFGCLGTYKPDRLDRGILRYILQLIRLLVLIVTGIDMGSLPIPPTAKLSKYQIMQCYKICQREGVALRNPLYRNDRDYNYPNDVYKYDNKYSDSKYYNSNEYNKYNEENEYNKYNDGNEYNKYSDENDYNKYNDDNRYDNYNNDNDYNNYKNDNKYNINEKECSDNEKCNPKYFDDHSGDDNDDENSNENRSD